MTRRDVRTLNRYTADRDAAAAALGKHFAHGRLTLSELSARLDATLTATTHSELAQASRDLPDLTGHSGLGHPSCRFQRSAQRTLV